VNRVSGLLTPSVCGLLHRVFFAGGVALLLGAVVVVVANIRAFEALPGDPPSSDPVTILIFPGLLFVQAGFWLVLAFVAEQYSDAPAIARPADTVFDVTDPRIGRPILPR
jgi:hypothetical protein